MKIFEYYADDVDHVWYDSSNIKYTECIDKENELKTLKVVFKNGTQYEYKNVNVEDYLMFREHGSQGRALSLYIKSNNYEYKKLENADLNAIDEDYFFRSGNGLFVKNDENGFTILSAINNELYSDLKLEDDELKKVIDILEHVGHKVKMVENDTKLTELEEKITEDNAE